MHARKILNIAIPNPRLQNILSKELSISSILAQLLINRGITDTLEAEKFLNTKLEHLLDPFLFSGMQNAVNTAKLAAKHKEKVMVFSDYDVDGVTSLTILKKAFASSGIDALHYIPHRIREGYGLSKNILHIAKERGVKLLITADCGTNSRRQIKELTNSGIRVIVTDHHEPDSHEEGFPDKAVIINPKLKDSNYKYRDLAGVGVAYKFAQAFTGSALEEDLDLVSLGTIADSVPLTGENRIIAKTGLSAIRRTKRPGLIALMESSGINDKEITPEFVSFILGPRINASGRMDTAEVSLNLLMSQHKEEACELARAVELHNRQRQKVENEILEEACNLINTEVDFKEHKIVVIAREGWHQGVLGIVAAKLVDKFSRPMIVISLTDGLCRGSGRSVKNFHLFNGLSQCSELLENFGGHQHAIGLVIAKDNLQNFKDKINRLAKESLSVEDLMPSLEIDMELGLSQLNDSFIRELEMLEPFGAGNPEPLFYTKGLKIKNEPLILSRDTLKLWVTDGSFTYPAIGFGMGSFKESLRCCESFDLVYTPRIDNWQGRESLILEIKEVFCK